MAHQQHVKVGGGSDLSESSLKPSYFIQVLRLNSEFSSLSERFRNVLPPGDVHQIGHETWGHRSEVAGRDDGYGSAGVVRSWRYLALTSEGLRVMEESRLASPRGEESLRSREAVAAPNLLTALRMVGSLSAEMLRSRVEEISGLSPEASSR